MATGASSATPAARSILWSFKVICITSQDSFRQLLSAPARDKGDSPRPVIDGISVLADALTSTTIAGELGRCPFRPPFRSPRPVAEEPAAGGEEVGARRRIPFRPPFGRATGVLRRLVSELRPKGV